MTTSALIRLFDVFEEEDASWNLQWTDFMGRLDRSDGPAWIYARDDLLVEQWRVSGEFYRADGPCLVRHWASGTLRTETWLVEGQAHREHAPAVIDYENDKAIRHEYRRAGALHREDGPAVEFFEDPTIVARTLDKELEELGANAACRISDTAYAWFDGEPIERARWLAHERGTLSLDNRNAWASIQRAGELAVSDLAEGIPNSAVTAALRLFPN